jgi:phospholipase C
MRNSKMRDKTGKYLLSTAAMLAVVATVASINPVVANDHDHDKDDQVTNPNKLKTATPIKHLVVVFNENRSFDHYFGTYPNALNPEGEPRFEPARNTPTDINNLLSNPSLLINNPNLNPANGVGASNPFRLDRTQANTRSQNHAYTPEQLASDGGKMDLFPAWTGAGTAGGAGAFGTTAQVMGIFDGNTVTAFWNYAQDFAMSDNMWGDTFGPSTPGLLNMFAGQTNGIVVGAGSSSNELPDGQGGITLIGDVDPTFDVCSSKTSNVSLNAKNIGDLLNGANIPWGSFYGGFNLQTINANGTTGCARSTVSPVIGVAITDYIPHHIWNQYFTSTANPNHLRPTSTKAIGHTLVPGTSTVDPANHNYDLDDFFTAVGSGNFPAVSFIKLAAFQDEHPGNSDPLDAQTGVVNLINFLQQQPDWESTAVIITYDDSDGWYDHAFVPPAHGSFSTATQNVRNNGGPAIPVAADELNGVGVCGTPGTAPNGVKGLPVNGRCGVGPRLPLLLISPFAKKNHVDHVFITQASVPQFIEDNWLNGERLGGGSFDGTTGSIMSMFDFHQKPTRKLILSPDTGEVIEKSK